MKGCRGLAITQRRRVFLIGVEQIQIFSLTPSLLFVLLNRKWLFKCKLET